VILYIIIIIFWLHCT